MPMPRAPPSQVCSITFRNSENKDRAGRAGTVAGLVAAMKSAPDSVFLARQASAALSNVLWLPSNAVLERQAGGVEALLRAMQQHKGEDGVQEESMRALRAVCCVDRSVALRTVAAGAVKLVEAALAAFPASLGVQEQGTLLLVALLPDDVPRVASQAQVVLAFAMRFSRERRADQESVERALRAVGSLVEAARLDPKQPYDGALAADAVLAAMRAFPAAALLQTHALRALRNLVANDVEMKRKLTTIGGLPVILGVLQRLQDNMFVQEEGLAAVNNLSLEAGGRAAALEAGALAVTLSCLHRVATSAHSSVKESACRTLGTLLYKQPALKQLAAAEGALEDLILILVTHQEEGASPSPGLLAMAARAVAAVTAVAGQRDVQDRAHGAHAAQAVCAALREYPEHEGVQWHCLAAVANLTALAPTERKKTVEQEGVISLALLAMGSFPASPGVNAEACRCLLNVCNSKLGVDDKAVALGALRSCMEAVRRHMEVTEVVEQGVRLLACLCWTRMVNRTIAQTAGVDVMLNEVMAKYPDEGPIQDWAVAALGKMADSCTCAPIATPVEEWPRVALEATEEQLRQATLKSKDQLLLAKESLTSGGAKDPAVGEAVAG